jgi:hypothetical protein
MWRSRGRERGREGGTLEESPNEFKRQRHLVTTDMRCSHPGCGREAEEEEGLRSEDR